MSTALTATRPPLARWCRDNQIPLRSVARRAWNLSEGLADLRTLVCHVRWLKAGTIPPGGIHAALRKALEVALTRSEAFWLSVAADRKASKP